MEITDIKLSSPEGLTDRELRDIETRNYALNKLLGFKRRAAFHLDWNLLMMVVDEIELYQTVLISKKSCSIGDNTVYTKSKFKSIYIYSLF